MIAYFWVVEPLTFTQLDRSFLFKTVCFYFDREFISTEDKFLSIEKL